MLQLYVKRGGSLCELLEKHVAKYVPKRIVNREETVFFVQCGVLKCSEGKQKPSHVSQLAVHELNWCTHLRTGNL